MIVINDNSNEKKMMKSNEKILMMKSNVINDNVKMK